MEELSPYLELIPPCIEGHYETLWVREKANGKACANVEKVEVPSCHKCSTCSKLKRLEAQLTTYEEAFDVLTKTLDTYKTKLAQSMAERNQLKKRVQVSDSDKMMLLEELQCLRQKPTLNGASLPSFSERRKTTKRVHESVRMRLKQMRVEIPELEQSLHTGNSSTQRPRPPCLKRRSPLSIRSNYHMDRKDSLHVKRLRSPVSSVATRNQYAAELRLCKNYALIFVRTVITVALQRAVHKIVPSRTRSSKLLIE